MEGILPAGTTGSIFWVWMLAITYSQFLYNRDLKNIWRLVLLGLVVATLFVAMYLGYGWKSGWIPPLVAMGVITWLRFRRFRYILTIGGVILIWLIASELIQSDQYSYVTRLEAWKIILNEIIRVNPIFGLGPANYRFYTPLFPIMGYWVEFNSHNNYIDIIAQIGVLGLIAFLWFAWEVWRLGWGLLKINLSGFSNAYVVGAMGGLVGMLIAGMLGDWVIPFVYNVGLKGFRASVLGWIFLGGLVAIQHIYETKQPETEERSE
jgi:O-antigen ligase